MIALLRTSQKVSVEETVNWLRQQMQYRNEKISAAFSIRQNSLFFALKVWYTEGTLFREQKFPPQRADGLSISLQGIAKRFLHRYALVAQLDRVTDSDGSGRSS